MDHEDRIAGLERRYLRLSRQSRLQLAVIAIMGAGCLAAFAAPDDGRLKVSELVVVDPQGVERVRIGGALPDAVVNGRRIARGERAAGIILYDGAGHERSGYATFEPSGNVLLTLDDRQSRQKALFVAGPEDGAALRLWQNADSAELRADADGARMTVVRSGEVAAQTPAVAMGAGPCGAYRDALARFPRAQVVRECRSRFSSEACGTCLDR